MEKLFVSERKVQWTSTIAIGILVIIGQYLAIYTSHQRGFHASPLLTFREIYIGVTVLGLALLFAFRKRTGLWLTVPTFLVFVLPLYVTAVMFHYENINLHAPALLFAGNRLAFLCLSILVPGPYWLNLALMGGFALEFAIMFSLSSPIVQGYFIQNAEPWVTVFYALVGVSMLWFRYHFQEISKKLAMMQAKTEVLEEISLVFLSIRDLANTPLQTSKVMIELLHRKYPAADPFTRRLSSATDRLASLNRIFKFYESDMLKDRSLMSEDEILTSLKKISGKSPLY